MTAPGAQLDASTLGALLREARGQSGMSAEQAAETHGLDRATLETLERRDPAEWGTDTRLLAALRVYGRLLGLDPEPMVSTAWRAGRIQAERPAPPSVDPLIPATAYRHAGHRRRRWLLVAAAFAALGIAGGATLFALGVPTEFMTAVDRSSGGQEASPSPPRDTAAPADGDGEGQEEAPGEQPRTGEDIAAPGAGSVEDEESAEAEALPGRPPDETPVQVLDALGDEEATAQVTQHLEELGYEIALVDTTLRLWEDTAAYYNEGWEAEAEALHARDDRFPVGGPNEAFVDDAGLHVVVGLDWNE